MKRGQRRYTRKTMIHIYPDGPEIIETARAKDAAHSPGRQPAGSCSSSLYKQGEAVGQITAPWAKLRVINAWWDRNINSPVMAFNASIAPDASPKTT